MSVLFSLWVPHLYLHVCPVLVEGANHVYLHVYPVVVEGANHVYLHVCPVLVEAPHLYLHVCPVFVEGANHEGVGVSLLGGRTLQQHGKRPEKLNAKVNKKCLELFLAEINFRK